MSRKEVRLWLLVAAYKGIQIKFARGIEGYVLRSISTDPRIISQAIGA